MSELKLKCCPFCGGEARVVLDYQDNETWAQCTTRRPKRCPMSSTIIPIEEWNTRRAQPEANANAKDAIRDALELYADSYDRMSRQNPDCKVSPTDVAYDIRRNMVESTCAAINAARQAKEKE